MVSWTDAVWRGLVSLETGNLRNAPNPKRINATYRDAWISMLQKAGCQAEDVQEAVQRHLASSDYWPTYKQIIEQCREVWHERQNAVVKARQVASREAKALPPGEIQEEDRAAARARLGITEDEVKRRSEVPTAARASGMSVAYPPRSGADAREARAERAETVHGERVRAQAWNEKNRQTPDESGGPRGGR